MKKILNKLEKIIHYLGSYFGIMREGLINYVVITLFIILMLRYVFPMTKGIVIYMVYIFVIFSWSCWQFSRSWRIKENSKSKQNR